MYSVVFKEIKKWNRVVIYMGVAIEKNKKKQINGDAPNIYVKRMLKPIFLDFLET